MTEMLFRGKHEDNGEWVYGNLLGDSTIVPTGQTFEIEGNKIYGCDLEAYSVDPETVGRYAGLTDKNDKKIFEGDIVKTKYGRICKVAWFISREYAGWDLIPLETINSAPDEWDLLYGKNLEIIGNIHDNK